jgi:phosphatidylserine/phosphatidylglycerophosphate/cardiolipin synthase-like enzyme
MDWLLISTGFTGALTLVYFIRKIRRWWITPLTVAVYHSPKGGCTEAVIREIQRARREVLVQAYSFTSKPIAEALIAAKSRGVTVEILLDRSNEQETYTELGHLIEKGLTPLIDHSHAIAHNKIMLIDRKILITGSFNFTHQAEAENAENLLVIGGHPDLLASYHDSFGIHKAHSQAPGARAGQSTAARKAA